MISIYWMSKLEFEEIKAAKSVATKNVRSHEKPARVKYIWYETKEKNSPRINKNHYSYLFLEVLDF